MVTRQQMQFRFEFSSFLKRSLKTARETSWKARFHSQHSMRFIIYNKPRDYHFSLALQISPSTSRLETKPKIECEKKLKWSLFNL